MTDAEMIENRTFAEIKVGDTASVTRTLSLKDIQLFALVSGDVNPAHLDSEFAETDFFRRIIAHGMWGAGLLSAVLGTELPGPGTIYLGQSLRFLRPAEPLVRPEARAPITGLAADQEGLLVAADELGVPPRGLPLADPPPGLPDLRTPESPRARPDGGLAADELGLLVVSERVRDA